MEFLVTMTTTVPAGTTPAEVDEMRAREAANTSRLAAEGRVLRLWRPPLAPGEWRSIGLFDAAGPDELEATLATMPLRVWRKDEVTPLGRFGNDPGRDRVAVDPDRREYLIWFAVAPPAGTRPTDAEEVYSREAAAARKLADEGTLLRLWSAPGRNAGLWQASGDDEMRDIVASLPATAWLITETVPLTRHPSDPIRLS